MVGKQNGSRARKRMLPPTYLLIAIVTMVALRFLLPAARFIRFPWTLLGLLPGALGVALNLLADRAFTRHQTTVKPFEESTALVTAGPYVLSRHPMYLGFTLILLAIAVFLGALTPFIVVPIFALIMECVFIRAEEPMMQETFGDAWQAYKAKVRRWI
jgi:protein-S-isoprenylcysteine O-methyltransferase Ste14